MVTLSAIDAAWSLAPESGVVARSQCPTVPCDTVDALLSSKVTSVASYVRQVAPEGVMVRRDDTARFTALLGAE